MHDGNQSNLVSSFQQQRVSGARRLVQVIDIISKNSKIRFFSTGSILSLLAACGGGSGSGSSNVNGDPGDNNDSGNLASGRVIDGYIADAIVFRDANGNNRYDIGELSALTDTQGYFET